MIEEEDNPFSEEPLEATHPVIDMCASCGGDAHTYVNDEMLCYSCAIATELTMTNQNQQNKMRKEFEAWYEDDPFYHQHPKDRIWRAWQAAYASRDPEIAALNKMLREQHQNQLDLLEQIEDCHRAVEDMKKPQGEKK